MISTAEQFVNLGRIELTESGPSKPRASKGRTEH